jgi:ATP-dependent Clp protease ATP-binding subunit ClpX
MKKISVKLLNDLEPEDLLNYGLIPEFVGRLPIVATLNDLDEDALMTILQEPKNALVKQYQTLFNMENVKLILSKDALKLLLKKQLNVKLVREVYDQFLKIFCLIRCSNFHHLKALKKLSLMLK